MGSTGMKWTTDELDVLKFLTTTHRHEFIERRSIEYRIVIAALTVPVAAVGAATADLVPDGPVAEPILAVAVIVLALIAIVHLSYMHCANNSNKSMAETFEDYLMDYVGGLREPGAAGGGDAAQEKDVRDSTPYWTSRKRFWNGKGRAGWVGQSLAILALAVAGALIILLG